MRKNLSVIAAMALILSALVGCSDSKSAQSSKKLLEAVETANRMCGKAMSQLGGPTIVAPALAVAGRVANVQVSWPDKPSEEIGTDLGKAEKLLSAAIREYEPAAGTREKALAQVMLGRILVLKGYYEMAAVAPARQEAQQSAAQALRAASLVRNCSSIIKYLSDLGALSDLELAQELQAARGQTDKYKGEVDKAQAKLSELSNQAEALRAANEKLIPRVRDLRVNSQLAKGDKASELLEQALKLETEMNANASAIARLESEADAMEVTASDFKAALDFSQGREEAAKSILAGRKGFGDAREKEIQSLQTSLAAAKEAAQTAATQLATACEKIATAEQSALESYDQAAKKFKKAQASEPRGRNAGTLAQMGDAYWSMANLQYGSLQHRARNEEVADQIATAWAPPSAVIPTTGKSETATAPTTNPSSQPARREARPIEEIPEFARAILAYLPKADEVRAAAIENYDQAAKAYTDAEAQTPAQRKWAYQGEIAAAYIGLYRLSGSAEAAEKAKAALRDALEDKRDSVYLTAVVELERLLQEK
ncbi:MAG: hypothetical protein WC869_06390 [Phycisphaerae bacterium]